MAPLFGRQNARSAGRPLLPGWDGASARGKGLRTVSPEVKRLHLGGTPAGPGDTERWPVHGFVVTYPGGAALVDTGSAGRPT